MDEVEFILEEAKEAMENAIVHLKKQLSNIRAGKATPSMLGSVMVDYYGAKTPLQQVANVNTPDALLYHLPYSRLISEHKIVIPVRYCCFVGRFVQTPPPVANYPKNSKTSLK